MWGKISRFVGFRDETGLVVRIGLVVGIGLGGTGLVVSLTYLVTVISVFSYMCIVNSFTTIGSFWSLQTGTQTAIYS